MATEQLAIIKQVKFGVGDYGKTALWFSVYITDSTAALQVFHEWENISKIVEDSGVDDINKLNGKACWVDTSTHGIIRFLRMAKI